MGMLFIPHNHEDLLLWDKTDDRREGIGLDPKVIEWIDENFKFPWSVDITPYVIPLDYIDKASKWRESVSLEFKYLMKVHIRNRVENEQMFFSVIYTIACIEGDDRDLTLFKLFWL